MSKVNLDELRTELAFLRTRLNSIESRLTQAVVESSKPESPKPEQAASHFEPLKVEKSAEGSLETGKLMGVVGTFCIIIAVAFLIKMSIDSGWLTPARQILGSFLIGASMIASSLYFRSRDSDYFEILSAAGIVVLYLATLGGHFYAGLYSNPTALFGMGGVSLLAVILFWILKMDLALWLAVAGTYFSPLLLNLNFSHASQFDMMIYYSFWNFSFAVISILVKKRFPVLLASYLAIWSFYALGQTETSHESAFYFQLFQFLTFLGANVFYSWRHKQELLESEAWIIFPSLLSYYGISYLYLNSFASHIAPYVALGFAFSLNGIYWLTKKYLHRAELSSGLMLNVFLTVVLFQITIFVLPAQLSYVPWIAIGYGTLLFCLRSFFDFKGVHKPFLFGVAVLLIMAAIQILLGSDFTSSKELVFLGIIYVAITLAGFFLLRKSPLSGSLAVAAHLQALFALYRLAEEIQNGTRFFVTLFWLLYAVAVLLGAYSKRDSFLAHTSLLVFGITAVKALLYDVSSRDPIIRVCCFLLLGAALYGGGYIFRKIGSWKSYSLN